MAKKFTETAPGVHTTTLTNPKTQSHHNIALIESCDAWQVFIDGELAVRDVPTFKAAVSAAEKKILAQKSFNMVRVAAALVVLTIAGGSTVGAAKLITSMHSEPASAITSETTSSSAPTRFTRVKPAVVVDVEPKQLSRTLPRRPIENVVVTVAKPSASAQTITTESPPRISGKPAIKPASLERPTADESSEKSNRSIPSRREPPVVINLNPKQTERELPVITASEPAKASNVEPSSESTSELSPPLPAKAPAPPLIRSSRSPISPSRLTSLLANLGEEEEDDQGIATKRKRPALVRARAKPVSLRKSSKRSKNRRSKRQATRQTKNKRSFEKTARRTYRSKQQRRARTRSASARSVSPTLKMTCFANTCRLQ